MFYQDKLFRFVLTFVALFAVNTTIYAIDVDKKLSDLIPGTSSITFLNNIKINKVIKTDDSIKVIGKLDNKSITISKSYEEKKSFTIMGDDLKISTIIPQTSKLSFLQKFKLDKIEYTPASLNIDGKLNSHRVSISKPSNEEEFTIIADAIKLSNILSETKNIKFLDKFALNKIVHSSSSLNIEGKINYKKITITKENSTPTKNNITLTGEDIDISDIFSQTKNISFLNKFKFDKLEIDDKSLIITGKIGSKSLTLTKDRTKLKTVEVIADKLKVEDIFASTKSIPVLNKIGFDKIVLDGKSIEVQIELNGEKVTLVKHVGQTTNNNYIALFFKELKASTFIPAAKGHIVNDLSLERVLFVILPDKIPSQTLKVSDLPSDISTLMRDDESKTMKLKSGVNILATLNVTKSGGLSALLDDLGVKGKTLPIEGTLSKSSFQGLAKKGKTEANKLSKVDKKSILEGLSLKISIPTPALPHLSSVFKVKQPATLSINSDSSDNFWKKLPPELQKKKPTQEIAFTLRFNVEFSEETHKETMNALVDMGTTGKNRSLSLMALSQKPWENPFGVKNLTINSGGFEILLNKSTTSSSKEIAFFGNANFSSHKNIAITADIIKKDSKVTLNYFSIDEKIKLSSFSAAKKIPHTDEFELDEIKLSTGGVEAKTTIASKKVDAYLFETSSTSGWTFAIEQKDFKIIELMPFFKNNKILKSFSLPNAAIIISESGIKGTKEDMPLIAKDMFDKIFGKSSLNVSIPAGIGFIGNFDQKSMGIAGEGLSKLGVHDDAIIMGEFTGVFKGTPGFNLNLKMDSIGKVSALPKKVMSYKKVMPDFYFQWAKEDLYVGAGLDMEVKVGKDKLILDTTIELELSEKGIGVDVMGGMKGTWHHPFGIEVLSLSNLQLKAGINDVGEVTIGFTGEQKIGKEDINISTEIDMLLEDLLPDGVAFSGSMSNIGIPAIIGIAEDLMKVPGEISKIPMPYFEVHDAMIAFATPGATDPQIGLVSEGFAFRGNFFFMNRELGLINGSGGPKGITLQGDIADIDLDILEFKKNKLNIAINLQPKFFIDSDITLLGTEEKVLLDIKPPKMRFDISAKMGVFGSAFLDVTIDGLDLQKGTFDKDADVNMIGEFKSTLVPWLESEIKKGIDELKDSATAKLDDDKKALDKATAKVEKINKTITKLKAKDQRAKQRADAKLDSIKKRVKKLKKSVAHDRHKAKHCGSKWTHWACKGYWETKEGITYAIYKVAEDALDAAKDVVNTAMDLDPEVTAEEAKRDIELAALAIAKAAVEVSEDAEKFVLNELDKALENALKDLPFEIDKAILIGDLKGMINNDDPLVLDMKYKMFGDKMHDYFALKIKDRKYDAVSFALLPALALDKLVESKVKNVSKEAKKWLSAHIGAKLAEAEQKVRKMVGSEEKKYKNILTSFENGSAKFKKAYEDVADDQAKIVSTYQISDLLGNSKTFKNRYLAIGHSSLCLAIAPNGIDVYQANCKDIEAERWTAKSIEDGYVQLKSKGLCLKAKNALNVQGQPLMLSQCDSKDKHEKWKVISSDGFFDQIVNKFSQKCLHFNSENANPKTAYAVWTSCLGTDSQTFRDISDAERPTWHHVNDEIKSKDGSCLSTKTGFDSYFIKLNGHTTITQRKKLFMLMKKDDILVARKCDKEDKEFFSYVEKVDGDVKLVHAKSGWCVVPKHDAMNSLSLAPCDKGKDMFWSNKLIKGSSFQMYNKHLNKCLDLKQLKNSSSTEARAQLSMCQNKPEQEIDFIK